MCFQNLKISLDVYIPSTSESPQLLLSNAASPCPSLHFRIHPALNPDLLGLPAARLFSNFCLWVQLLEALLRLHSQKNVQRLPTAYTDKTQLSKPRRYFVLYIKCSFLTQEITPCVETSQCREILLFLPTQMCARQDSSSTFRHILGLPPTLHRNEDTPDAKHWLQHMLYASPMKPCVPSSPSSHVILDWGWRAFPKHCSHTDWPTSQQLGLSEPVLLNNIALHHDLTTLFVSPRLNKTPKGRNHDLYP